MERNQRKLRATRRVGGGGKPGIYGIFLSLKNISKEPELLTPPSAVKLCTRKVSG